MGFSIVPGREYAQTPSLPHKRIKTSVETGSEKLTSDQTLLEPPLTIRFICLYVCCLNKAPIRFSIFQDLIVDIPPPPPSNEDNGEVALMFPRLNQSQRGL